MSRIKGLLNIVKALTENQLESISGGANVKSWIHGGIVSLMILGTGAVGITSNVSAELAPGDIASSSITETISGEYNTRDSSDLETAQNSAEVDQTQILEKRQLTDEQKLYALKALNLQDAYAFLQSGVIKNLRLFGNISKIELDKNGNRIYAADQGGDAFANLLYMLYPSNDGNLNVAGGGEDRLNFSKFGGVSSELMAKFCAIANDYRNGKVEIPESPKNIFDPKTNSITNEFQEAVNWLRQKNFNVSECENSINVLNKKEKIILANKIKKLIEKDDSKAEKIINSFKKKYGVDLPAEKEARIDYFEGLVKSEPSLVNLKIGELRQNVKESGNKLLFYLSFINSLKGAIDLENSENSQYPEYLTERILMSYMIKTLNTTDDIKNLYNAIGTQLVKNKTNKLGQSNPESGINSEIEAVENRIGTLNEIIKGLEVDTLSPYKTGVQSNGTTYTIGNISSKGKVQINSNTFADCADIAARHVVNLLAYSNDKNWDLLLKGINEEDLKAKLSEVTNAIKSKSQVPFYDLKTRLQIFFLYQKEYGADDVSPLARTLWEYAICNMNEENLQKGPDKGQGFYPIKYAGEKNYEFETGYLNMLKFMWNMAKALGLGTADELESAKRKIDSLEQKGEYKENDDFKENTEAFNSVFSLFHKNGKLNFSFEKMEKGNDLYGNVKVDVTGAENEKLSFSIKQYSGHGEVKYDPMDFKQNGIDTEKYKFDEARLLLRSLAGGKNINIEPLTGFLRAFSGENLKGADSFGNTDLYKKYKALKVFNDLQGEDGNIGRISYLVTLDVLNGSKEIEVKGKEIGQKKLSNIFCENYLKKCLECYNLTNDTFAKSIFEDTLYNFRFGSIEKIYKDKEKSQEIFGFKALKTSENGDKVKLIIASIPQDGKLSIPAKIYDQNGNEFSTESIGKSRFMQDEHEELEKLKEVIFEGDFSNLKIYGNTFGGCALESITIPDGVTSINDSTFVGCGSLTSIEIPDSVTSIENDAFQYCGNLTSITIPDSVTSIGSAAFAGCRSLPSITIPDRVTSIGDNAFWGCSSLTSIEIPNSVTSIGGYAFFKCTSLTSIEIPNSVTSIEMNAFSDCSSLTSIEIPNSVTSIDRETFSRCSSLTSIKIPDSVTSIGDDAFWNCSSLTSITIPDSVTSIGYRAFNRCDNLKNIVIPKNFDKSKLSHAGVDMSKVGFSSSLEADSVATGVCGENLKWEATVNNGDNSNPTYKLTITGEGKMYDHAYDSVPWKDICGRITEVSLPEGVISIGDNAFFGCSSLTSITIPNSVTSIGNSPFDGCDNLNDVTIPERLKDSLPDKIKNSANITFT